MINKLRINKLRINKKAELTTQQIVILIVLITSFAILLLFLFRLNPGEISEEEICHNSVVMQGKTNVLSGPLNCKTSYVCISKDGTCEEMTNPEIKKAENKNEVYQILADEMADCWWMFGEGKIDYVGKDIVQENLYCSICSQIAFDNSVYGEESIFEKQIFSTEELYNFMEDTNISKKNINYYEYMYEGQKVPELKDAYEYNEIKLESRYYVVMGITSEVSLLQKGALSAVLVGAGVFALLNPPVAVILGTGMIGGVAGYYSGTIMKGASGLDYLRPTLIEVDSDDFKSLNCKSINTLA